MPERDGWRRGSPLTYGTQGLNAANAASGIAWAKKHGVLGVDGPRTTMIGLSSLAIEDYLGRSGPDGFICTMTGKTRRCLWCYQILAFDDDAPKKKRKMRGDKDFCGPQQLPSL